MVLHVQDEWRHKANSGASLVLHVPCRSTSSASQPLQQTFHIKFVLFSLGGAKPLPRPHPITLLQNLSSKQVFMHIICLGNQRCVDTVFNIRILSVFVKNYLYPYPICSDADNWYPYRRILSVSVVLLWYNMTPWVTLIVRHRCSHLN